MAFPRTFFQYPDETSSWRWQTSLPRGGMIKEHPAYYSRRLIFVLLSQTEKGNKFKGKRKMDSFIEFDNKITTKQQKFICNYNFLSAPGALKNIFWRRHVQVQSHIVIRISEQRIDRQVKFWFK